MIIMKKYALLAIVSASALVLASCASTGVNEGNAGTGGIGTIPETGTVPPTTLPPVQNAVYVVQLIASSSVAKANRIRDQFIGDGYQAVVSPLNQNGQQLYRVQIGSYTTEVEAMQQLNIMKQRYAGAGNIYVNEAVVKTR